jgi:GTP-binding protein HflX
LVESFKSTLDELRESDILLHVVDVAHPQFEDHIVVVNKLLKEFNATELPCLTIFNKIDAFEAQHFDDTQVAEDQEEIMQDLKTRIGERVQGDSIFISATQKTNIAELRSHLLLMVQEQYKIRYPYRKVFY